MNVKPSIAAALLAMTTAASAQVADRNALPLWEIGVLGGAASTPAYPGSSDRSARGLLVPFLIYRGKVFRADQSGIGARLFNSDRAELDVGLAASLPAKSDAVAARAGMPNLGTLLEVGPRLKVRLVTLSESSRLRLDIPLRAVVEVKDGMRGQGWTFEPKVVYENRSPDGRWTFDANVGLVVGDRKINRYFYEVQPQYATASRPTYQADSGLVLVRTGASASRSIGEDLRVFGFVRLETYKNAANKDSPLMKRDNGASAGVGFAWTLSRSTRRAGD